MTWETIIGLETHVELCTKTKIFCACTTAFGGASNTHCCPVCTGMPGTLPVLNERVLEFAVKAGLALGGAITRESRFDRKNYFYPDLPKAYQISQLYYPISRGGAAQLSMGGREKCIRICELHMEEDAGKLTHDPRLDQTMVDYNRCGVPLIEIVTEPDFRTADEVVAYLEQLKLMLQYLGVSDCKMQEGSLRCDVNISVRPLGSELLGTRTEMKNMSSLKAIARAIAAEEARQMACLEAGGQIRQETRRWDEHKDVSFAMRSKENAQDYRYFPDPDLPPLEISDDWLNRLRADQPELAEAKQKRYLALGLSAYDAQTLTAQRALAEFFEGVTALGAPAKESANWIMGPVLRQLSALGLGAGEMAFTPETLVALISLVSAGKINRTTAITVFDGIFEHNDDPVAYVAHHGLQQINDAELLARTVETVFQENLKSVEDFRGGKEKALDFLVGQVMGKLRGKADPQAVNAAIREKL